MREWPPIAPMIADADDARVPVVVGLTGGMGSGKSTVGRMWETWGIPRWDADAAGAALYRNDASLREAIGTRWGKRMWVGPSPDQHTDINRKELRAVVFQDPEALQWLNALVHPRVRAMFSDWWALQLQRPSPPPYVLRESALLLESGFAADCDVVILVTAPEPERIARIQQRDGLTVSEIRQRWVHQWPDARKFEHVHAHIQNGPADALLDQIALLHSRLRGNPT